MAMYGMAGCKIFIGTALNDQDSDFDEDDFALQTWKEIGGWETMGAFGDTSQVITTSLINRGRDIKQKGTRNAGSMENVFAIIPGDEGQEALIAAEKTNANYAFKIEFNDAALSPPSPTPQPSKRYFIGLVVTAQEAGGDANTVQKLNATIEINSNVVHVAATP